MARPSPERAIVRFWATGPAEQFAEQFACQMFGRMSPMIYVAKNPLKPGKITNLCRWRDADGRQQTRRLTDEESARVLLERPSGKRTGGTK
jgi:hypothetical protein